MKIKYIFISSIILIFIGAIFFYFRTKPESYLLEENIVKRGDMEISVRASAIAIPKNRLEIKPPITGRVESVLVSEGSTVKKGQIIAWMSSTERAALLDAARAKSKEEIKQWEDFYKPTPVISPLKGLVIAANIRAGQTVTQQDILYVLSDNLMVQAKLDETDLSKIKIGQKARILVDSFSDVYLSGKVSHLAFEAVTENNVTMYNVDLDLENIPDFLRSGMSITVDFLIFSEKNVLLISNDYIKHREGEDFVLVKMNGNLHEKHVTLGKSDDQLAIVLSGVEEGESIFRKKKIVEKKESSTSPFSTPRIPKR